MYPNVIQEGKIITEYREHNVILIQNIFYCLKPCSSVSVVSSFSVVAPGGESDIDMKSRSEDVEANHTVWLIACLSRTLWSNSKG